MLHELKIFRSAIGKKIKIKITRARFNRSNFLVEQLAIIEETLNVEI